MYLLPSEETARRYVGAVLGAAIGDALAAPTATLTWPTIVARYGDLGIQDYDDAPLGVGGIGLRTERALAMIDGLLESPTPLMDAGTELGCSKAVLAQVASADGREAARTSANVAASFTFPIGLVHAGNGATVREAAKTAARYLREPPADVVAAVFWNMACAFVADGTEPGFLPAALDAMRCPWSGKVAEAWAEMRDGVRVAAAASTEHGSLRAALTDLGDGRTAQSAVTLALCCFYSAPDDFDRAILAAANVAGDSQTVAAMTGAIVGLRCFPGARWTEPLQAHRRLATAGYGLAILNATNRASLGW